MRVAADVDACAFVKIINLYINWWDLIRCEPFDPAGFKSWALSGRCSANPDVLRLFVKLIAAGFKVFLVTGRDEETLGQATIRNLHNQGFFAYHRLILRYIFPFPSLFYN